MAPALKPALLQNATDAAAIQKLMKADLKSRGGKKGVKFIAAKNCVIGARTISLFIVTDTPALFEAVIKTRFPKAYRAKGTCDVLKGSRMGTLDVVIKTSAGQITPDTVVNLVRPAVGSEKSIQASYGPSQTPPGLKPVGAPVVGGVPEWAKKEYKLESVETVIASMTPDKKIGSIYFEGDGRIRTTHASGPQRSKHDNQTTVQFNINQAEAEKAFQLAMPKEFASKERKDHWKKWLRRELGKATADHVPSWAKMVQGPDTAYDVSAGGPPDGTQLIEIFKNINSGKVEGWHPSRGVAARFVTDKQTISVLKAAIKYIDDKKLTDPNERNVAFYEFVKSRLPKFTSYIRDPKTVKTK